MVPTIRIAQDDAADELLGRDPLALVVGMLHQHVSRATEGLAAVRVRDRQQSTVRSPQFPQARELVGS